MAKVSAVTRCWLTTAECDVGRYRGIEFAAVYILCRLESRRVEDFASEGQDRITGSRLSRVLARVSLRDHRERLYYPANISQHRRLRKETLRSILIIIILTPISRINTCKLLPIVPRQGVKEIVKFLICYHHHQPYVEQLLSSPKRSPILPAIPILLLRPNPRHPPLPAISKHLKTHAIVRYLHIAL